MSARKTLAVPLAFTLAWIVATAALLASALNYQKNTLARYPHWVHTKPLLQMMPFSTWDYLSTRNALHRCRLNLGAWHGCHEITFDQRFEPGRVALDVNVDPRAYIEILFNRGTDGYDGFRLARSPDFHSFAFHADAEGRYTRQRPVPDLPRAGRWQHLEFQFSADQVAWSVNGRARPPQPSLRQSARAFSLRGNINQVLVDNVEIRDRQGKLLLRDRFDAGTYWLPIFLRSLAALLMLALLAAAGIRWRYPSSARRRRAGWVLLTLLLTFFGCTAVLYAFDFYYWSRLYNQDGGGLSPNEDERTPFARAVEKRRAQWLADHGARMEVKERYHYVTYPDPAIAAILTRWDRVQPRLESPYDNYLFYPASTEFVYHQVPRPSPYPAKAKGTIRIGYVGTSQTYGEGSTLIGDNFVARTNLWLNQHAPRGRRYETFNFAVPGWRSGSLLTNFQREATAELDVLLINLSNNDGNDPQFPKNIAEMIRIARAHHARVILLLEAQAMPALSYLDDNHRALRAVGAASDVPVWDLHGALRSHLEDGQLFWDRMHMSSLGAHFVADWLAPQLADFLGH